MVNIITIQRIKQQIQRTWTEYKHLQDMTNSGGNDKNALKVGNGIIERSDSYIQARPEINTLKCPRSGMIVVRQHPQYK